MQGCLKKCVLAQKPNWSCMSRSPCVVECYGIRAWRVRRCSHRMGFVVCIVGRVGDKFLQRDSHVRSGKTRPPIVEVDLRASRVLARLQPGLRRIPRHVCQVGSGKTRTPRESLGRFRCGPFQRFQGSQVPLVQKMSEFSCFLWTDAREMVEYDDSVSTHIMSNLLGVSFVSKVTQLPCRSTSN